MPGEQSHEQFAEFYTMIISDTTCVDWWIAPCGGALTGAESVGRLIAWCIGPAA